MLSLTCEEDQKTFWHLLNHPMLKYVHFAPPCGTCSRAREISLKNGKTGPPPLRDEVHPLGLPHLEAKFPQEVPRVQAANRLYQLIASAATVLLEKNITWTIENPRGSLLWYVPGIRALCEHPATSFVHFQHCAYGGDRPKWTGWLSFPPGSMDTLRAVCPGESPDHQHAAWGCTSNHGFATSLETVYPMA